MLLTCNAALFLRVLVARVALNVRQKGKLLLKRSGGAGSRQGNQDNLNTKCCKLQVLLNCLNQRLLRIQKLNLGKKKSQKKDVLATLALNCGWMRRMRYDEMDEMDEMNEMVEMRWMR